MRRLSNFSTFLTPLSVSVGLFLILVESAIVGVASVCACVCGGALFGVETFAFLMLSFTSTTSALTIASTFFCTLGGGLTVVGFGFGVTEGGLIGMAAFDAVLSLAGVLL